jgi:hypothetical protein
MKDGTKIQLVKDDSSTVIHGFEELDYGGGPLTRQVSGVAVLTAALQACGEDVTYADVMGISGAAFKLHMGDQWCPSSGCFDLNDETAALFGLQREMISADEEENPDAKERMKKAVVASIDQGIPVPYTDCEHSLLVGYRNNGESFVYVRYAGESESYSESPTPKGIFGDPWHYDILTKGNKAPDWRTLRTESLRTAVKQAKTDDAHSGFKAYLSWAKGLRNPPEEKPNLHAYAYCYVILHSSRQAAAQYLTTTAAMFEEPTRGHLLAASRSYDEVWKRLWDNMSHVTEK